MSVLVKNIYNTYIKLPKNVGIIHAVINIKLNDQIIRTYNTSNLLSNDKYELLLFDGKVWKKITNNGINTTQFNVISVNYDFEQNKEYVVEYKLLNSENEIIKQNQFAVLHSSYQQNNFIQQKCGVVQNIDVLFNKETNSYDNIILHWNHSTDYDEDDIFYQIEIEQLKKYGYATYFDRISLYQNSQESQYYPYIIPKSGQNIQREQFDQGLFQQNVIYRYRVRAFDSYGQFSNWSSYYYFKKIKSLYGTVLVRRKFFSHLYNSIQILPVADDLLFSVNIKPRFSSQFYSSVHLKQLKNSQLFFTIQIQKRQTLYKNLFGSIHVTDDKYLLGMEVIISKRLSANLFHNIYIKNEKLQLLGCVQVVPTLIQQMYIRYRLQLMQKLTIICLSQPINQYISVSKRFLPDNCILNSYCTIGKRFYKPIQITIYDSDGVIQTTDNRIKIYNYLGQRIYTYNKDGQFVNVYPYVYNRANNPLTIYDYDGEQILQYYDQEGNLLDHVYTSENIVKNWLPQGIYKIQYTKYDSLTSYSYNYAEQSNVDLIFQTREIYVNVNLNSSCQWTFAIRALKNGKNIHKNDTYENIYINIPPKSVNKPFYINGQYMNNDNIINNSNPTFSFYGVRNDDNDTYRYIIQISNDQNFNNIISQNEIDYSPLQITHTLQDKLLNEEGWYYFRVLTVDYNEDQQKQTAFSPYALFKYQYSILNLYGKIQRVNFSWIMIGFILNLRGNSLIEQQVTICKQFDSQELNGKIMLYYELVESEQLQQMLIIRTEKQNEDLIGNVLITHNYSDIISNIIIQINYANFPKTQTYIDEYGQQHTIIIADIPESHYIRGKCLVYKYRIGQDIIRYDENGNPLYSPDPIIFYNKIKLYNRYSSTKEDEPIHQITIRNRLEANDQTMKCFVWNKYQLPYKMKDLVQMVAISNRVNMIAWLFGKLQLKYPQPPNVIVTSNIKQRVWQSQYNATFDFELQQQPTIPIMFYIYVFDEIPNTTPNINNGTINNGRLTCDLRNIGNNITGVKYLHVKSVNVKGIYSSETTHYVVYYNNRVERPTPEFVNGQSVVGNQMPVIQYTNSMLFYWTIVIDTIDIVDKITYDLQISTDINFTNIQFYQQNISGNFFNILSKTLQPNKYYWRVRAFDQNEYSDWSTTARIYVNKAPQAPTRLSVKNYS